MKKDNYKFQITCPMCKEKKDQDYSEHFLTLEDIAEGKEFKCNNCNFIFNELSYIQQSRSIKKKTNKYYMEDSIQTPEDALHMIRGISLDYDGYRKAENLMELINELSEIAATGLYRGQNKGEE